MDNEPIQESKLIITPSLQIDTETQNQFREFYRGELQQLDTLRQTRSSRQDDYKALRDDTAILGEGGTMINRVLQAKHLSGFINFAQKNDKIIGASIVVIDKRSNEVKGGLIGVSHKEQRQGIAGKLIQARHNELRKKGITSYNLGLTDESRALFIKNGYYPEEIETNPAGQVYFVTFRTKSLISFLNLSLLNFSA